jgi:DHA1 family tetracycline resistance protein-like MFS transporter
MPSSSADGTTGETGDIGTTGAGAEPRGPRKAALAFIFVTVVLDVLALGVVLPVLPRLIEGFLHGDTARAAEWFGVFATMWAFMQFFFSPVLGALSDRYGRRPIIRFANFGLGFDYIVMALAPTLPWLFLGRAISGITGASFTTAWAYVADVSPPEKRAASFGFIGAAWGLGFVLGPAMGGVLGGINPRLPFWVAAGLTLLNATYGLFVLPESLPKERRAPFSWKRANPLGSLSLLRKHKGLLPLAGVNLLYYVAHQALSSVFVLYAGYRYGWGPTQVGLTLSVVGVLNVCVQAGLVRPLVARFGERWPLITGLCCGAVGMLGFGLARTGAEFWIGMPVLAFMGLYGPSMQGIMTKRVQPTEQGRLQGANSSTMGIAGMVGPAIFTLTFAHFISPHAGLQLPGAPFYVASGLLVLGAVFALGLTRPQPALVVAVDASEEPEAHERSAS